MSKHNCIRLLWILAGVACLCAGLPTSTVPDEQDPETTPAAEVEEASPTPASRDSAPAPANQGAPKITYSKLTEVNDGENLAIDCEVKNVDLSGLPGFKILWGKVGQTESGKEKVASISSNEDVLLLSDRYNVLHTPNTYRYSLEINKVNEKDSGTYRCTVVFGADQKIDADVPVSVLKAAYFSDQTTKTIRVREGDAISIDCQPGGYPKPEVYWERLGEELPFYGGQFFKANQFELPLIDRTHVGNYLCYADNGLGEPATSEVIIEVEYKPTVALKETQVAASVYDQVNLECLTEGLPEPSIYWTRNGVKLSPSSNININTIKDSETGELLSKLKINQVQVDEFSDYSCVAENSVGTVEGNIRVEMKVPPSIEKQTRGELIYELHEDENRLRNELPIAVECVGSGVPAPDYRWTKNDEVLLWQSDPRMSLEPGTGTLLIEDPSLQDNGVYQCFAYNDLGVAASDKVVLTNHSRIDFIRSEPGEVEYEAPIGRPFRLRCPEVVGHPTPELTWMKARQKEGGVEMEYVDGNRMVVDDKGTLWISHVLEDDDTEKNGFKYVCLATSDLHPKDISLAKTITLKTVLPPDGKYNVDDEHINIETFLMHSSPKDVQLLSNVENRLWCIFGGEPLPQVIWQRTDGKEISAERFYEQNKGQTLVIKDTQLEDAGEYECIASNDVGEVKKYTVNVTVNIVPKFQSDFRSQAQVVHEGTSVTFSCSIMSEESAQPEYEWFFNSVPLDINQGSRRTVEGPNLMISSASVADTGNYACRVSNDAGYAYGQTTLSVIPKSHQLMVPSYENQEVLKSINTKIDAITEDVRGLKQIVEQQAQTNQVRQKVLDLLNEIAKKVLAEDYKPVVNA